MDFTSFSTPAADVLEQASDRFAGQWFQLVSTTNWDKGRIIAEWREELRLSEAHIQAYSDDSWAQRVGGVSSQHVGRLRRVWDRFGTVRENFQGLFWSHFQAALDWDDAEMWLEGAARSDWSVAQMRRQRWETLGSLPGQEPREDEIVASELDEDFQPDDVAAASDHAATAFNDSFPDFASREVEEEENSDAADPKNSDAPFDTADSTSVAVAAQRDRPFADLVDLPADLQDALESFKLAILRHRLADWEEVPRKDVVAAIDALRRLVMQPSDA